MHLVLLPRLLCVFDHGLLFDEFVEFHRGRKASNIFALDVLFRLILLFLRFYLILR